MEPVDLEHRLHVLERSVVRSHRSLLALGLVAAALAGCLTWEHLSIRHGFTTHALRLADDTGAVRLTLGEDGAAVDRRSRATGITLFDGTGAERGGMSTFSDGSAVIALDAPTGKGVPMPDRVGMMVDPNGHSTVMVIDNDGNEAVTLRAADHGGDIRLYAPTDDAKTAKVRHLTVGGDAVVNGPYD